MARVYLRQTPKASTGEILEHGEEPNHCCAISKALRKCLRVYSIGHEPVFSFCAITQSYSDSTRFPILVLNHSDTRTSQAEQLRLCCALYARSACNQRAERLCSYMCALSHLPTDAPTTPTG